MDGVRKEAGEKEGGRKEKGEERGRKKERKSHSFDTGIHVYMHVLYTCHIQSCIHQPQGRIPSPSPLALSPPPQALHSCITVATVKTA